MAHGYVRELINAQSSGPDMSFLFKDPHSWSNQSLYDDTPYSYGITPLWTLGAEDPDNIWYLFDLSGALDMENHRR